MNTIAFDGRMGASGDMLLGALIDAGASTEVLDEIGDVIDVDYRIQRQKTHGLAAVSVTITPAGAAEEAKSIEGHGSHRSVAEVLDILESLPLGAAAQDRAEAAFRLLGEAEAAVHDSTVEDIHFHEVGADDAIADIAGVAALISDLAPDRIVTTPVAFGGGEVDMSHGRYPVPTPAVVEIAKQTDLAIVGGPVEAELLTPTGAALLGSFADPVSTIPPMTIADLGIGSGKKEFSERPNVLRVYCGEVQDSFQKEEICVLETNVDDVTPEVLGNLHDSLLEAGARDVSILPLTMKKSRPGHLLRVIVHPNDAERLARRITVETGSLGVRMGAATNRWVADRRFESVEIDVAGESFAVPIKIGTDPSGSVIDQSAEFDAAARVASQTGKPVREIIRLAESKFEQ